MPNSSFTETDILTIIMSIVNVFGKLQLNDLKTIDISSAIWWVEENIETTFCVITIKISSNVVYCLHFSDGANKMHIRTWTIFDF